MGNFSPPMVIIEMLLSSVKDFSVRKKFFPDSPLYKECGNSSNSSINMTILKSG